jgi:hypothetical protein
MYVNPFRNLLFLFALFHHDSRFAMFGPQRIVRHETAG